MTPGISRIVVCGLVIGTHAFVEAGTVVNRYAPNFAPMAPVPALQVGWGSRFGEPPVLPLPVDGEARCPHTGERYLAADPIFRIQG